MKKRDISEIWAKNGFESQKWAFLFGMSIDKAVLVAI
jgi:hypothetical protein